MTSIPCLWAHGDSQEYDLHSLEDDAKDFASSYTFCDGYTEADIKIRLSADDQGDDDILTFQIDNDNRVLIYYLIEGSTHVDISTERKVDYYISD